MVSDQSESNTRSADSQTESPTVTAATESAKTLLAEVTSEQSKTSAIPAKTESASSLPPVEDFFDPDRNPTDWNLALIPSETEESKDPKTNLKPTDARPPSQKPQTELLPALNFIPDSPFDPSTIENLIGQNLIELANSGPREAVAEKPADATKPVNSPNNAAGSASETNPSETPSAAPVTADTYVTQAVYEQTAPEAGWLEKSDSPAKGPEKSQETTKEPEKPKPVKLSQVSFSDAELAKAVETAKSNKLPLIVYTGADFCHYCPAAKEKVTNIANGIAAQPETKGVVVKLTAERAAQLMSASNDQNSNLLRQVMSHGTSFPRLGIYDPNNMSKPVESAVIGTTSQSGMQSLINKASDKITGAKPAEASVKPLPNAAPRAEKPNLYTESSLTAALESARKIGTPFFALVNDKLNPRVEQALQYLNQNKLATAVDINKAQVDRILTTGTDTNHYRALKSVTAGGAKPGDESAHISSFPTGADNTSSTFAPLKTSSPQSPEQMIQFFKDNGVRLSSAQEGDLMKIMGAKLRAPEPVRPNEPVKPAEHREPVDNTSPANGVKPVEPSQLPFNLSSFQIDVPDVPFEVPMEQKKLEVKPKEQPDKLTNTKVETAEQLEAQLKTAKESDLPIVIHSKTMLCDDKQCFPVTLNPETQKSFRDKAVFIEMRHGGVPLDDNKNEEIAAINKLFKTTPADHKQELEVHVFSFDAKTNKLTELPPAEQAKYRAGTKSLTR